MRIILRRWGNRDPEGFAVMTQLAPQTSVVFLVKGTPSVSADTRGGNGWARPPSRSQPLSTHSPTFPPPQASPARTPPLLESCCSPSPGRACPPSRPSRTLSRPRLCFPCLSDCLLRPLKWPCHVCGSWLTHSQTGFLNGSSWKVPGWALGSSARAGCRCGSVQFRRGEAVQLSPILLGPVTQTGLPRAALS